MTTKRAVRAKGWSLSFDELAWMYILVSGLDPDRYKSNEVKALIYKCKSLIEPKQRLFTSLSSNRKTGDSA